MITDEKKLNMAPIRTFEFDRATDPDNPGVPRKITCALANHSGGWLLVRTSAPEDEYEPHEWSRLSAVVPADPTPAPAAGTGNPVFYLKNYSENKGMLEKLEARGVVRPTGRVVPQGYVQLPEVEVLVSQGELIRACGLCTAWEEGGGERHKRCTKCRLRYYCSRKCQAEDWKGEHKALCKEGLTEEEVFLAEKAKTATMLETIGFKACNLGDSA